MYEPDELIFEKLSKTPIVPDQKPVKFLEKIVELFSSKGDWIFDGLGGIGIINSYCANTIQILGVGLLLVRGELRSKTQPDLQ